MSKVMGFLKWCSLLAIAPLAFIGLFVVFGLDEFITWAYNLFHKNKIKSTYEEILEEHDMLHEDETYPFEALERKGG